MMKEPQSPFHGEFFQFVFRKGPSGYLAFLIVRNAPAEVATLRIALSTEELTELATMAKIARAMIEHLDDGGTIGQWFGSTGFSPNDN